MQRNFILFIFVACIMMACGNGPSTPEKPVEKASAPPPVYKMDMMEKMFNNDNWMKAEGRDTSYYYFSRISSAINIHQYKMTRGDSVISNISAIRFSGDSLVWDYNDTIRLFLTEVTQKSAAWARLESPPGSFFMAFEQKDEKHIQVTVDGTKPFLLTRTQPLSSFLIRSRYDYLHGTNYAFTDTVFSDAKK